MSWRSWLDSRSWRLAVVFEYVLNEDLGSMSCSPVGWNRPGGVRHTPKITIRYVFLSSLHYVDAFDRLEIYGIGRRDPWLDSTSWHVLMSFTFFRKYVDVTPPPSAAARTSRTSRTSRKSERHDDPNSRPPRPPSPRTRS